MIEVKKWMPEDVVDQEVLKAYQNSIPKVDRDQCPIEVQQYIDAVAKKLGDFEIIGQESVYISGYELQLCGMKEFDGEKINAIDLYPTSMPIMKAVDHRAAMYRHYKKKGKQGLIDFTKSKVKASSLERILSVLTVSVFKEESEEFKNALAEIQKTKKD